MMRVRLTFPEPLVRQPVISQLVQRFAVVVNIRRASVEVDVGWMICELDGEGSAIDAALAWVRQLGVEVDLLGDVLES